MSLGSKKEPFDNVASRGYAVLVKAVGIRELKDRLSSYLRLVRQGEEILITDRGEVIAELKQPSPRVGLAYPALLEMVRQGRARMGLPNSAYSYRVPDSVAPEGTAARLLDEERGER